MSNIHSILKRPLLTEKGQILREKSRQYLFEVASSANKIEITKAVESLFAVRVDSVNTHWVRGKDKRVGKFSGRKSNWKKAIVTLHEGNVIELFEGA